MSKLYNMDYHNHLFYVLAYADPVDAERKGPGDRPSVCAAHPGAVRQRVYGDRFRIQPRNGLPVVSDRLRCGHGHRLFRGQVQKAEVKNATNLPERLLREVFL